MGILPLPCQRLGTNMSDRETTDNFWEIFKDFRWPEVRPVFYRCYYHDDGTPNFYTMEDLPGQWIEVTKEIYLMSPCHARVIDGTLKIFEPKKFISKLKPHQSQGTPCDHRDICVISDSDNSLKWKNCENEID